MLIKETHRLVSSLDSSALGSLANPFAHPGTNPLSGRQSSEGFKCQSSSMLQRRPRRKERCIIEWIPGAPYAHPSKFCAIWLDGLFKEHDQQQYVAKCSSTTYSWNTASCRVIFDATQPLFTKVDGFGTDPLGSENSIALHGFLCKICRGTLTHTAVLHSRCSWLC